MNELDIGNLIFNLDIAKLDNLPFKTIIIAICLTIFTFVAVTLNRLLQGYVSTV